MADSESFDFLSNSKAVGLPFLQKMADSESIDFLSKGKAIGLPFLQKWLIMRVLISYQKLRNEIDYGKQQRDFYNE